MTLFQLPPSAEDIRKEIKEMIPETATSEQPSGIQASVLTANEDGTKTYGGVSLMDKMARMKNEMNLKGVCPSNAVF